MEITETARIRLVIDGAEAGVNELGKLRTSIDDLKKKRGEYEKGSKEWGEFTEQIRDQEKAYRAVEQRMEVSKMTLSQLTQYQKELRRELRGLEPDSEAFNKVAARLREVNARTDEVNGAIRVTNQEVEKQPSLWDKAKGAFAGFLAAFTLQAVVGYLKDLASRAWETVNSFDRMHMALKNVSSSQEEYKNNLQFLNQLSNNYGQNLGVITKAYTGFIASTKSTNLSLQEKQRIYESVIKAGSALTMSNEQIEGSLLAMSQMFSKGNIQAEELRGQLGERLPGAFGIMAKALGVNEAQLNKMLEQGKVLAEDALPKFATALEQVYGSKAQANLNTYQGAMNRLGAVITNHIINMNEQVGITRTVASGINWLADNLDLLVKVLATAATAIGVYLLSTKAVVMAKTAWVAIEKTALLLKGEAILAQIALAKSTDGISAANIRAAASARAFNNALLANPYVLAATALAGLAAAFVFFKTEAEQAREQLSDFQKGMAEAKAPIIAQQMEFNNLAKEVQKGNLTMEEQEKRLLALKGQYPELIGHTKTLQEAEKILRENKIETNSEYDYRVARLNELKEKFPDQLKGITNLKEAELKLGGAIDAANAQYAVKIKLMELEYAQGIENAKMLELIAEKYRLTEQLKTASAKGSRKVVNTGVDSFEIIEDDSQATVISRAIDRINEKLDERGKKYADLARQIYNENKKIQQVENETTTIVNNNEDKKTNKKKKESEAVKKIREKHAEDILKIEESLGRKLTEEELKTFNKQISNRQKAEEKLLEATTRGMIGQLKSLAKHNDETEVLARKRIAAELKIKDKQIQLEEDTARNVAILNAQSRSEIEKINETYDRKALEREEKNLKARLAALQLEQNQRKIIKLATGLEDEKAEKELAEDILKILKELNKNKEGQYKLDTAAKKGELKEQEKLDKDDVRQQLLLLKNKAENAEQARLRELVAERLNWGKYQDLTKDQMTYVNEIVDEKLEKRRVITDAAFSVVNSIVDMAMDSYVNTMELKMNEANSNTERALIENKRRHSEWAASVSGVLDQVIKGNIVGAAVGFVTWFGKGLANEFAASKRMAIAEMEDLKEYYENFINDTKDLLGNSMSGVDSAFEGYIKGKWDDLATTLEMIKAEGEIWSQVPHAAIEMEIARANKIKENFQTAVGLEKDFLELQKKNINEKYDLEVNRINQLYKLKDDNAALAMDKETMTVKQGMADQLLALITNLDSRRSLEADYEAEREKILANFDLADDNRRDVLAKELDKLTEQLGSKQNDLAAVQKELLNTAGISEEKRAELLTTEAGLKNTINSLKEGIGSTQVEYDSVTASIVKRDAALSKLLDWYIAEIETVSNNEDQKRTEYTETERIRKEGEKAIEDIQQKGAQAEIKRNQDKNEELLAAQKSLKDSLFVVEEAYNDKVLQLTLERDALIKASWENLRQAVIDGYEEMRASAQEAYNMGLITAEQLRETLNLIYRIHRSLGDAPITPTPQRPIDWGDWDFNTPNIPYGFASGTDYVDAENRFPSGVDTVPAMLTKGERVMDREKNRQLGPLTNDEVVRIVNDWRELQRAAVADVTSRNSGLIRSLRSSNIASTGMPVYTMATSTAGGGYSMDTSRMEAHLAQISEKLNRLEELQELKEVKEEIRRKPVLSLDKLQQEGAADELNRRRSTFA